MSNVIDIVHKWTNTLDCEESAKTEPFHFELSIPDIWVVNSYYSFNWLYDDLILYSVVVKPLIIPVMPLFTLLLYILNVTELFLREFELVWYTFISKWISILYLTITLHHCHQQKQIFHKQFTSHFYCASLNLWRLFWSMIFCLFCLAPSVIVWDLNLSLIVMKLTWI